MELDEALIYCDQLRAGVTGLDTQLRSSRQHAHHVMRMQLPDARKLHAVRQVVMDAPAASLGDLDESLRTLQQQYQTLSQQLGRVQRDMDSDHRSAQRRAMHDPMALARGQWPTGGRNSDEARAADHTERLAREAQVAQQALQAITQVISQRTPEISQVDAEPAVDTDAPDPGSATQSL